MNKVRLRLLSYVTNEVTELFTVLHNTKDVENIQISLRFQK